MGSRFKKSPCQPATKTPSNAGWNKKFYQPSLRWVQIKKWRPGVMDFYFFFFKEIIIDLAQFKKSPGQPANKIRLLRYFK